MPHGALKTAAAFVCLAATGGAQAGVPPKPPRDAPAHLGGEPQPLVTRTWTTGERISNLDLALFDENNDRRLDHRDSIYRQRLVVRTRGGRRLPGAPPIQLTPQGPVFKGWLGPQPVTVWARERFGLVDGPGRPPPSRP